MTILCYHAIDPAWQSPLAVLPSDFAAQCDWLSRTRHVVRLSEAVRRMGASGRLPRGLSALTFDDGFSSVYEHAFSLLLRYRLPATVFIVAKTLTPQGRVVDWIRHPPPVPPGAMTLEQILDMREAGIDVGSHSYSHVDLVSLSEEECERDLRSSRELLEDLLHAPIPFLAYPRGLHDSRVRRIAERAGYSHAFTLPEGPESVGRFSMPRIGIYRGNRVAAVRVKASEWYLRLRTSRASRPLRIGLDLRARAFARPART